MDDKDIRFSDKKVDESWKEQATREKEVTSPAASRTSKPFMSLLSSLGYQAMFHLGDIPNPETQQPEVNLEAAREVIELLLSLKDKTKGNLSAEEAEIFNTVLPELQLKFSQKA